MWYTNTARPDQGDDRSLTMSNTATNLLFQEVNRRVQQHMSHPYLDACEIRQSVSRFHFDVAYAILEGARVPKDDVLHVLEAVLLLQQGLSIHDDVDQSSTLHRQLFVLAGDYNSSQYYHILAKLGQFDLLSKLCDAVVKMNEAKMKVVVNEKTLSSEDYMRLQQQIQGSLLNAMAEHFLGINGAWVEQIQSLVKAYVVQDEISVSRMGHFSLRQAYEWLSDSMENVLTMPSNTIVGPLYNFLLEYLQPLKKKVESLNFAEGNR